MPPPTHRRSVTGIGRRVPEIRARKHLNWPKKNTKKASVFGRSSDQFSLSFSLFLLCFSFRTLFFFRVERVRKGRSPIQPLLSPKTWSLHVFLSWCFFPTYDHQKPGFSLFLSVICEFSLFFCDTLFLVSYSLRFPHRKGSERHGPCPALFVPPKPRLCMSFCDRSW